MCWSWRWFPDIFSHENKGYLSLRRKHSTSRISYKQYVQGGGIQRIILDAGLIFKA
jgi:hypothetical protein